MTKEPKIGDEYFHLFIDEATGDHEWWIYRVRTIQNRTLKSLWPELVKNKTVRYVYATQVNQFTWGKRSSKHGDFGWLDPIDPIYRDKWRADEQPHGLFKTKKAALKHELAEYHPENYDTPEIAERVFKKIENMLKRC